MRTRWLVAGLATAAVLVGSIVAAWLVLLRGDQPLGVTAPSPSTPAPTAAPVATTAQPSPTPAPTSDPTVAQYLKPLVSSWRPTDTTAIAISMTEPLGRPLTFTLIAVPPAGGAAVPLITVPAEPKNFDMRRDGSAVVVSVEVSQNTSRLAMWDARANVLRWITAEQSGVTAHWPRWSPDGEFIFFGRARFFTNAPDLGLFRIKPDGTDEQRIRGPLPEMQVSVPHSVTDDGLLFWWRSVAHSEGLSLEALNLRTGQETSAGGCLQLESSRPTQPRNLLQDAPCGVGVWQAGLVVWDDVSGSKTILVNGSSEFAQGADWDLAGTRIVVSLRQQAGAPSSLVTMDTRGGSRTPLPATENARYPLWLRAGIVFVTSNAEFLPGGQPNYRPPFEVRLVPASGGTPRSLYRTDDQLVDLWFVRP